MDMKLSFLGATQNVTGSRFLLETNGTRILVDCGLYQERQYIDRNWDPFPIPPDTIDTLLLTHAHLDHCGYLPKLVKDGFKGRIISTRATAEITRIVLLDSAHLQEEDAEFKKKRHAREGRKSPRPIEPLYTTENAEQCLPLFQPTRYEQTVEVADGIDATFYDAGHILGAAMIKLNVKNNTQQRTILFSGDVGRSNRPILHDPTLFEQADYVLTESTYGDRIHEDTQNIKENFAEIINATHKAGGNIVIPSFAIERAQEVLYYLNELRLEDRVPHLLTFLDSPMAARVTKVFTEHPELFDEDMKNHLKNHESPFKLPGLTMTRTSDDSKAINHLRGTAVIIAGSGMCTGGRIKHHLVNNISRPESTILFVGYQAIGTLGRLITEGRKEVRILGEPRTITARIARLHGFSGHADKNELIKWIGNLKQPPKQVFVVHGDPKVAKGYCKFLHEKTNFPAVVPEYGQTVTLN